jgi:hypothetical protein
MKRFGLLFAVLLLFAAPAAQAATPARVTGKLTGAKLPRAGQGRVVVWAVHLPDGVVTAGTSASPSGRFTLKMRAGEYAILAAVVPRKGRGNPIVRVADFVTAKAGKRRTIKPTLKKRHKKKRRRAKAAGAERRFAWVDAEYPVVWVHRWSASGPAELTVMEKGLQDMFITDLSASIGTPECEGAISAGDDFPAVLGEIALQQSPYFDRTQRLTTAHLVRPNASLTGTLSVSGGVATIAATYADQRPGHTGQQGTVAVSGPAEDLFSLEQQLVPKITDLVCQAIPKSYTGSFSGTWTTSLNSYTVTWTGDAVLALAGEHGSPPPDAPEPPEPQDYANYTLREGRVHAVLNGTRGACTVHGEADFTLASFPGFTAGFVQSADQPWFSLNITGRGDEAIPYTETGPIGCGQQDAQYPLNGVPFAFTPKPLRATDRRHLTGNTSWDPFGGSSHMTSMFTFNASE